MNMAVNGDGRFQRKIGPRQGIIIGRRGPPRIAWTGMDQRQLLRKLRRRRRSRFSGELVERRSGRRPAIPVLESGQLSMPGSTRNRPGRRH